MKKILLAVSLFAGLAVSAQSTFTNITTTAGVNSVFTSRVSINQLNFVDTSGANNLVIVYDGNNSTNVITPAFTNYVFSTVTFTNTYTDSNGYTNNYIYTLGTNTPTVIAASTNEARRVWVGQVPPNGQFLWTPNRPINLVNGLTLRTTGAGLGIVSFQQNP